MLSKVQIWLHYTVLISVALLALPIHEYQRKVQQRVLLPMMVPNRCTDFLLTNAYILFLIF
jgi:hypothetical protein